MGNAQSAVDDLVKQLEGAVPSTKTGELCQRLVELLPYWDIDGRARALHDLGSAKLLESVFAQLGHELSAVNLAAREYSYDSSAVGTLLHCLDHLLVSKALYKLVSKQNLGGIALSLRAAVRRGDDDVALQAATAVRAVIERVGFREFKAGKEANQVSREADAKEKFVADGLVEALLDAFAFLHARSNPLLADALVRIAVSLLCSRQDTTPFPAAAALHAGLMAQHLPLLFEFSRHAYPRLHVSACGLLKGLFLEGGVDAAAALQAAGLEWGALVWHLRWAVAPAAGDDAFALPSPAERLLCERLWADCGVPLGAEGVAGGGRAGLGACCAHGPLIDGPEGSGVVATGWSATAPAARGVHLVHRLAREASRELVAVLCFRNAAATAAVERVLPAGLAPALRSPTTRQAGGSVSLFDAGVAPGTASSAAAVEESAVAPAGVARAPVPSTCDESMFTSPRARVVYVAAPAATASPGKGPKKQSQQKQAQGGQPGGDAAVASWLSTALWSGDADVPVALGRSGCLWWDAALCSPAANRAQRQAVAARVKVAWLGVEPQSRASHTGPSAAALEGDAAATAVTDGSTEAAPPPPPTPAASSGNASRYEPTILVVQTAKGDLQWRSLWWALSHGPVLTPRTVWTRDCLLELRDWLWAEEAGLDRRRRQAKRSALARGDAGRETGVASAVAGASVASTAPAARQSSRSSGKGSAAKPSAGGTEAGRAWFGFEDAADQSHLVPDTRSVGGIAAAPSIPWDAATCQATYASLDNLLCVDGLFVAHLLPALLSAARPQADGAEGTAAMPAVPPSFPRRALAALVVETNPRRRLALLQTLRVLAACSLADPCLDAGSDPLAISRLTGLNLIDRSASPLESSAFDAVDGLVEWCLATAAQCSVGLADTGPSFGAVAGPDGAYANAASVVAPINVGVFGLVVRAHVGSSSGSGSATGASLLQSALWPPASAAAGLVGGGEQPYWIALLRQECVLLLRLLLNRRSAAVRISRGDIGIVALLQLLQLPGDADEEAPVPRPPTDDADKIDAPADDSGAIDMRRAYTSACGALRSASIAAASAGFLPASDVLAVPTACWDAGLPRGGGRAVAVANPFPGAWSQSSASRSDESVLTDPDSTLVVNHRLLKRATIGRAAVEALQAAVRVWPPVARSFAREDVMQALVLPLLHAPRHPRIVGGVLQLLRSVLPQIPTYASALSRHAFTQAVLLTALPPAVSASLEEERSSTDGDSDAFAILGVSPGLCADAVALLQESHLAEYDDASCGWLEFASAPARTAARLLVDAADTGVPEGAVHAPEGSASARRSNSAAFQWSSQDARAASLAATASSSLAPFLPPALIRALQDAGPQAFARIFNAERHASPTCLWSSVMRRRLLDALQIQVNPLRSWVQRGAAGADGLALHPSAAIDSHVRVKAAAGGLKSISQMHGLSRPFPTSTVCSASALLCVPPILRTPAPTAIAYPELDSEPRVGGVYLRAYVEGQDLPSRDAPAFMQALVASLHREVAAVLAAHLATARQISHDCLDTTGRDALAAYECAHSRALLTLRALRRMLAESPGAKLEADAYAPLAALFASVLGRYPTIASEGILLPPPNTGDIDDAAVHRLSATAIFLARDLPLLPLSLELLLPPDCIASCDPNHNAFPSPVSAVPARAAPASNPFEVAAASRTAEAGNPFELPSNSPAPPLQQATRGDEAPPASLQLFACVKSALHASALRCILVGRTGDSSGGSAASDGVMPGSSASAGVHTGGSSLSLIAVALDVVSQSIKPGAQQSASRKAVQAAVEGGLWPQIAAFLAWAVPLHPARGAALLAGLDGVSAPDASGVAACLPAVGTDPAALSAAQRLRLFIAAPLSVAALRIFALACNTDPGTQLLIDQPQLLVPVLRAARTPWPGGVALAPTGPPAPAEALMSWLPSARMCFSAGLRISEPALDALLAVAPVFALRQPLLDLGAPALLLLVAAGGPTWRLGAMDGGVSAATAESAAGAFSPRLSASALAALLARRPERLRGLIEAASSPKQRVDDSDEMSSFDVEDAGTLASPDASHVLWLWPLRLVAEDCLRILCDKSGSAALLSSGSSVASPPPSVRASNKSSRNVVDAGFSLIAEEAAADLEGDDYDAGSAAAPSAFPSRKKSVGVAKAALFRSAGTAVAAAQSLSRLSSSTGSFAVSAAERSVRGAPPLVNHLQATTAVANVVRNLVTPGLHRILSPSALESLSVGGSSAVASPRSIVRILRGASATELPHLIWTPDMLARLLSRLSREAAKIDQSVLALNVFQRVTGVEASLSFGLGASPSDSAATAGGGSAGNPFDAGSAVRRGATTSNPFGSTAGSNPFSAASAASSRVLLGGGAAPPRAPPPTQAPVLWAHEAFDAPELWRELYPALVRELVVLGVYVRVYMKAPPEDLDAMRPTPAELITQIFFDMDGINASVPAGRPYPPDALATLTTLSVAAADLFAVKPSVVPRAAGCLYARVIPALLVRDQAMQRGVGGGGGGNPFGASPPPSNPFGAAPPRVNPFATESAAASSPLLESWQRCLQAALFVLLILSTYTPVAESSVIALHTLHVILRREERARGLGCETSLEIVDAAAATGPTEQVSEAALLSLRSAPTIDLALGVVAQTLLHAQEARAMSTRCGLVAALLAVATASMQPQRVRVRLLAWQALGAATGAAKSVPSLPNDSDTWRPSTGNACLLLAPPVAEGAVDGGELDDPRLLVSGAPAAYVCAVAWPLFDTATGRGLPALLQAWIAPGAAAARWSLSIRQPLVLWSDETRADAAAFLKTEWALVDEWLAAHPSEPCVLRSDDVSQRMPRPTLDAALYVGGVFVRLFNAAPHSKEVEIPAFAAALAARLVASTAALQQQLAGGGGADIASDAVDFLRALSHAVEACSDSRSADAFAEVMPHVCEAVLSCLHVGLPSALTLCAGAALPSIARAPGALAALARQPAALIVRLLHCLAVAADAEATAGNSAAEPAAVAVFSLISDIARRSDPLTRAIVGSALLPHCVRSILFASASGASPGARAVGAAAAACASALVLSEAHGAAALGVLCELLDPGWAAAGVWGRRPEGVLEYAAAAREASAASGGRCWDASAREALGAFLSCELGAVEAALQVPGAGGLDASLARWDVGRVRVLHAQPIDRGLLQLSASE